MAPPLTAALLRELLDKLAPAKDQLVLIGGQALSLWAERYGNAPELRESGPHTSKDIDFYGKADQVRRCAALLGGTHRLYGRKDRTPICGVITTADGVQIDILHTLAGVTPYAVVDRAVELTSVRVMHPIHVMASRAANVSDLRRTDTHALRQLRASAFVVREHTREALDFGLVEEAYELNDAAFDVVADVDSLDAWRIHGIDLFDAILVDPRLGDAFQERHAQMRELLMRKRSATLKPTSDDDD